MEGVYKMNLSHPIKRLRALEKNATKGPWHADLGNWQIESRNEESFRDGVCTFSFCDRDKIDGTTNSVDPVLDADFITEMRNALPELLDALDSAKEILNSGVLTHLGIVRLPGAEEWLTKYFPPAEGGGE